MHHTSYQLVRGNSIPKFAPDAPAHFTSRKLEGAKARISELVRRARDQGPQAVTVFIS
jgi:hypothetical protein